MKHRNGFTLIEVMIVLAIVAMLAALAYPVFARAKLASKVTVSISQLRQLHLATMLYQADYDGDGIYGSASAMGLPPPPYGGLRFYGFVYSLMVSPCGCHPSQNVRGPCPDFDSIEPVWDHTWWEELAPLYRQAMPLYWDMNCNDYGTSLHNELIPRRGNAVLLSGTAITKLGTGKIWYPTFFSTPEN